MESGKGSWKKRGERFCELLVVKSAVLPLVSPYLIMERGFPAEMLEQQSRMVRLVLC